MYDNVRKKLETVPLKKIFSSHSELKEMFLALRIEHINEDLPMIDALSFIPEEVFTDLELTRESFTKDFCEILEGFQVIRDLQSHSIHTLRILGGVNKDGDKEKFDLTISKGQIVSIVGPTGAGKSRLLADIECLAQEDTPTRRRIMLDGKIPSDEIRFSIENRMIAQLSQNMNFIIDLTVKEFLFEHAKSRLHPEPEAVTSKIFECANELAGEYFRLDTPMTQLSGGQSRALMIADTALLSDSPIVLIDEIENAGIDRKKAVKMLAKEEKIVLISTHDPLLAMSADIRIVIRNGGIEKIIEANKIEQRNIPIVEEIDKKLLLLREYLRSGKIIDFDVHEFFRF